MMKNGMVFLGGLVGLTLTNLVAASLSAMHPAPIPPPPPSLSAPLEVLRWGAWPLPLPLPCGRWSLSGAVPEAHPGQASFDPAAFW